LGKFRNANRGNPSKKLGFFAIQRHPLKKFRSAKTGFFVPGRATQAQQFSSMQKHTGKPRVSTLLGAMLLS